MSSVYPVLIPDFMINESAVRFRGDSVAYGYLNLQTGWRYNGRIFEDVVRVPAEHLGRPQTELLEPYYLNGIPSVAFTDEQDHFLRSVSQRLFRPALSDPAGKVVQTINLISDQARGRTPFLRSASGLSRQCLRPSSGCDRVMV